MEENLNTPHLDKNIKLRDKFIEVFLDKFIDFSKYENNIEFARDKYLFARKLFKIISSLLVCCFMIKNLLVSILVIILFLFTTFSFNAFKNKLLSMNLLDEKIRLQEENSFMNDQGGLFYFFLIKLPIMLAVLVAVCLIYIYVKLN